MYTSIGNTTGTFRARLLSELKKEWINGINKSNIAVIDNYEEIYNNLLYSHLFVDELFIYLLSSEYSKTILISIKFPLIYPFRPPKIKINSQYDYFDLCGSIPTNMVKEKFGLDCICCNSMLCNWGPTRTLNSLMEECLERLELKLRSNNINFVKLCVIKKFGHYLPISEFL